MPSAAKKFLIISLAGIGDTLFATPMIRELRTRHPDAVIDAFVLWKGAADVLAGNPHLNTVFQHDLLRGSKADALSYVMKLRRRGYDVSINTFPQSRVEYRVVAFLVGAKLRLSHDYRNSSFLDEILVSRCVPKDYTRHCVMNNLALLRELGIEDANASGGIEMFLNNGERTWAEEFLAQKNLAGKRLLGAHVGSGGTKNLALRRWPVERFAALFQRMREELPDVRVLLFGGPEEREAHAALFSSGVCENVLLAESRSLREAAALVKHCHAFLSVDTSLMHVAALMKVPGQIVIETPTWNPTVEPFGNPFTVVRNPAVRGRNLEFYRYDGQSIRGTDEELRRIMESVRVEDVFAAVKSALRA